MARDVWQEHTSELFRTTPGAPPSQGQREEAPRSGTEPEHEVDRAPASERIEAAAGVTIDDIQDPAAEKLLEMLFLQVNDMELEVKKLKKENKEINDRLAVTEEKAEVFHADTRRKLDQLVRDKDAGATFQATFLR